MEVHTVSISNWPRHDLRRRCCLVVRSRVPRPALRSADANNGTNSANASSDVLVIKEMWRILQKVCSAFFSVNTGQMFVWPRLLAQ